MRPQLIRRGHGLFLGAEVLEHDAAILKISLCQAGAGRRGGGSRDRCAHGIVLDNAIVRLVPPDHPAVMVVIPIMVMVVVVIPIMVMVMFMVVVVVVIVIVIVVAVVVTDNNNRRKLPPTGLAGADWTA